jgi:hypothetical protein
VSHRIKVLGWDGAGPVRETSAAIDEDEGPTGHAVFSRIAGRRPLGGEDSAIPRPGLRRGIARGLVGVNEWAQTDDSTDAGERSPASGDTVERSSNDVQIHHDR